MYIELPLFMPPSIPCKYLDGECFDWSKENCENCKHKELFYKGNEDSLFIENLTHKKKSE